MRRKHFTAYEKRVIGARQAWRCANCDVLLDETFECDHSVALCFGGEDAMHNLAALCPPCHRKKTVHEEMKRVEALQQARRRAYPALYCSGCDHFVSPMFFHKCIPRLRHGEKNSFH